MSGMMRALSPILTCSTLGVGHLSLGGAQVKIRARKHVVLIQRVSARGCSLPASTSLAPASALATVAAA